MNQRGLEEKINMEFFKRLAKALRLFFEAMKGKDFVPISLSAEEELVELPHPDCPGGLTRRELYYGITDKSGCPAPIRPIGKNWVCTKCKEPVQLRLDGPKFRGEPIGEQTLDIICPCGQVNAHVDEDDGNNTLVLLENEGKITSPLIRK